MNDRNPSNQSDIHIYDSTKILNLMNDPNKLAIILELLRKPGATSAEIKRKLSMPGSRIYYYLNQLTDNRIIEEFETEKITEHLSRRKFRITKWFNDIFIQLDEEFHKQDSSKMFFLFQLQIMIAILTQHLRSLEKIPEHQFNDYINNLNIPYQQIFFIDKESLSKVNSKHKEVKDSLFQSHEKYKTMIDIIRNSSHFAIFGAFSLD
ncbi:MAG: winged helix-turn-helix transcriptional regulator [Promethearchaeota archaeon]